MFLGVDIGGTNIKAAIVDDAGSIVHQLSQPTEAERGKDAMLQDIRSVIENALRDVPAIRAVGVGITGIVHPTEGCVYYPPNLPGWEVVPLADFLRSFSPVPVAIDNDANVAALAESELGAGRNFSHFLYVTLGTGVGGGIIINNRLFTGERGGAGEIGHIIIDINARRQEGQKAFQPGTLEEYIGRKGILHIASGCAERYPDSLLHSFPQVDVRQISAAAEQGDQAALECFETAGTYLGLGLVSILSVLDMRAVVVGGGISQSHPLLLETAQRTLRERSLPTIAREAQVIRAHFGNDAGVVGAAMLGKLAVE